MHKHEHAATSSVIVGSGAADAGESAEQLLIRQALESELPLLVVVWTDGTGIGQGFLRLLEEWAPQADGRLQIFRLDAARSPKLAKLLGIPLAPGLALFSQGVMRYQFIGNMSRRELDEVLERASILGALESGTGASGGGIVEPPKVAE